MVGFLKTDPKARYQGYMFYFKEGFCWSLINGTRSENDLKFRLSTAGVYDVGGMSLHSAIENIISHKYIVCIGNSDFVSRYTESFVNFTVNFQINDARQIPIIIPKQGNILEFEALFDKAVAVKQAQFSNSLCNEEADCRLNEIQNGLDVMVNGLYGV